MKPDFPLDRKIAAELLEDPETLATTLLMIALTAYGDEVFGDEEQGVDPMDPIDLWNRLEADFRVTLPLQAENRLNALKLAIETDAFFDDPLLFTAVAGSLYSGDMPDMVSGWFDTMTDELTVPEALWAIFEVELVRDDDLDYSVWVKRTLDRLLDSEGEEDTGLPEQVIPYYERFVEEMKAELLGQLTRLGVDRALLQRIQAHDPLPAHDDVGEWESRPDSAIPMAAAL